MVYIDQIALSDFTLHFQQKFISGFCRKKWRLASGSVHGSVACS